MDKLIAVLEKAVELGKKEIEFPKFRKAYLVRLHSEENRVGGPTGFYSPRWKAVRLKRGLTNDRRNYHFTYKMANTMKITNFALYTEGEYYKFLTKRFPTEVPVGPVDIPALVEEIKSFLASN